MKEQFLKPMANNLQKKKNRKDNESEKKKKKRENKREWGCVRKKRVIPVRQRGCVCV